MPYTPNDRGETALKQYLARRLSEALVGAQHHAQANVRYDTGDLHDSIRVIPPEIGRDRILSGLAAGGTYGQRRGAVIDYAMQIEERYAYLRPAIELSDWERDI